MRIFIVIFLSLIATACNTSRQASHSTVVTTGDTVEQRETNDVKEATSREKETVKTDSTFGISPKTVSDSLQPDEQEITRTNNGKARPVYKEKREDWLTVWVAIDTNGTLRYGAKTDSITLVVQNLVREKEVITQKYDSLYKWVENQKRQSVRVTESVVVKEQTWWGKNWKTFLQITCCLLAVIFWNILKGYAAPIKNLFNREKNN